MGSRRATTTRAAAALTLTGALLAGCGDDDPTALPSPSPSPTAVETSPEPTASPTGDTRDWATCVSTRTNLQVSYPAGWTARDYPDGGCAYFDPEPFEVQRGTEAPAVTVRLDVESVAYERVTASYLGGEVISQRETTVAGYPAVRIEDNHTQGPLGPKGRRLTYIADLGDEQTLLLTTNQTDANDFAQAEDILDEMAERVRAGRLG